MMNLNIVNKAVPCGISRHMAANVLAHQTHKSPLTAGNECRLIRGDWFDCLSVLVADDNECFLQKNVCKTFPYTIV